MCFCSRGLGGSVSDVTSARYDVTRGLIAPLTAKHPTSLNQCRVLCTREKVTHLQVQEHTCLYSGGPRGHVFAPVGFPSASGV